MGDGPFLWLSEDSPPAGFSQVPLGGMCISAFLFVRRGEKILLGKYANDPRWESLTGLDESRRVAHGQGWTLPASQLRFGEDPREAARRIGEEVLQSADLLYSEPRVEVDRYEPRRFPGRDHYDIWFLVDAFVKRGSDLGTPPWYAALEWKDPRTLPAAEYARSHEDVVAQWRENRTP